MSDWDGQWLLNDNEDDWSFAETFATLEDAIESIPDHCEEYDTEHCFIGKARSIKLADLFCTGSVHAIIENMEESDDLAWRDEHTFEMTDTQASDLRALILDWMRKNLGEPGVFTIDYAQCYTKDGSKYE